ncbi:hypothetical protein Acsp03_47880 [Actinomadura sp. NBRC 104412]|nr:hypothetical protein Acsp03_47880 [Actinomadura sp. NBRC 104412]
MAAAAAAAGVLGVGLYVAVPAFADDPSPSASPKPTASQHPRKGEWRHGKQRPPMRHKMRGAARGVHGEATVRRRDGSFHVTTWQRGQITGVSGATVTVRSADGVVWAWTTDGDTRVRKNGEKSKVSALASGDQVVVRGERAGTARTAAFLFVPKKR